jgi:SAM-dependent methyltransferase
MRVEEAQLIGNLLGGLPPLEISPLVNIGSSTLRFRTEHQPHIERSIFAPLAARGVRVLHADMKAAVGVDLVGDVLRDSFRRQVRELRPKAVLCSNVLEHVENIAEFVAALEELTPPGGFLLVSVPRSYPYHLDPIDNGFRPDPDALIAEFPRCRRVAAELVLSGTYFEELVRLPRGELARRVVKSAVRVWVPFYKPAYYKNLLHRWLWIGRRYSVTIALMQRLPVAGSAGPVSGQLQ